MPVEADMEMAYTGKDTPEENAKKETYWKKYFEDKQAEEKLQLRQKAERRAEQQAELQAKQQEKQQKATAAANQTNLYAGSTSNQVINANPALKKISDRQIAQRKSELQEHLKSIKPGEPNLSWFQRALLKVAGESGSDPASESSAGSPLVPSGGAIKREGYVETLRKAAEQDEDPVLAQKYKDMNALRNGTYR